MENNHLLVRRVMPKGASFDRLRQEHVDSAMSHVNSYPRLSLDGKTPYDEFVSFYGERGREFLERLNIRRVGADFVTLAPSLLGLEFKREADNAILRKTESTNENYEMRAATRTCEIGPLPRANQHPPLRT